MLDSLHHAVAYLRDLPVFIKVMVLTVAMMLEYLVPLFPGNTVVLLAGMLKARDGIAWLEAGAAIMVGSLLGMALAYRLGALLAKNPNHYPWLQKVLISHRFSEFNHWYRRWGIFFILFNRFFLGVRALVFIAAGAAHLSFLYVLLLGAISALIFNAGVFFIGYWLSYNLEAMLLYSYHYHVAMSVLLSIAFAIIIYVLLKKKRRR
jgi:membrane protein DedA with SNARE-associated domain